MKLNLICSCFAAMCAAFVVSSCSSDDEGTTTVNVRNVYTTGCKTERLKDSPHRPAPQQHAVRLIQSM